MPRLSWSNTLWLAAYLALTIGVVVLMFRVRASVLREMGTDQALADWQQWREEASRQTGGQGPVQRRMPGSYEPPALVLMRDRFPAVLIAAVAFSSVFFGFAMFVARGLAGSGRQQLPVLPEQAGSPARGDSS